MEEGLPMNCSMCGERIHPDRLEILPDTHTCTDCSDEERMVGFMIYSHKTAGEVIMTSGAENVRRLQREYHRAR
jgi:hypothetical protein